MCKIKPKSCHLYYTKTKNQTKVQSFMCGCVVLWWFGGKESKTWQHFCVTVRWPDTLCGDKS